MRQNPAGFAVGGGCLLALHAAGQRTVDDEMGPGREVDLARRDAGDGVDDRVRAGLQRWASRR
jgi:hypothetical protein